MKKLASVAVALALVAGTVFAAEFKSGLQPDQKIPPFYVTKVAGPEDGVTVGQNLCYRCKYGARPQVMIFSRVADERVAGLVKKLDEAIAKNDAKQLKVFVNILGESRDAADAAAKKFAASTKAANVPVVVPDEFTNGPDNYGINPKAELTIIIANQSTVVANHAFEKDSFCESCLDKVLADVASTVK